MKRIGILISLVCLVVFSTLGCTNKDSNKEIINISAASSLKDVMVKLKEEYEAKNKNIELVINYGSSGSLMQQIEHGAPCDIFISAGKKQIDELDKKEILNKDSIKTLAKNSLVLISEKNKTDYNIDDLTKDSIKHIGLGYPKSVPAGEYAYETLEKLGIENKVKDKLVYAKDVKEVLAWTQMGNVDVGFVYFTDTVNNDKVRIVQKIDSSYHLPIVYPMAIIKNTKNENLAKDFQGFLLSEEGQKIISGYGYEKADNK